MTKGENSKPTSKQTELKKSYNNRTMKINVPKKGKRTPPGQKKS